MFTVRVSAHSRHSGVICDHSHPSGWKVVPLSSWFWFAFSWRANDGDHIFVGLVAVCVCVCVCLFRKYLCSTFAHFLNWVVFFVCVIRILYYIPDISPLSDMWFTDIFSCSLFFFFPFRAAHVVYGGSQARGQIGAAAAGQCHSHSNAGSKPHLQPILHLTAMPDP